MHRQDRPTTISYWAIKVGKTKMAPHLFNTEVRRSTSGMTFQQSQGRGFTLVEMLVSMVLLILLCGIIMTITTLTTKTSARTNAGANIFQESSDAFENLTRKLSRATLNTYWDYYPTQSGTNPSPPQLYVRRSELHFIVTSGQTLMGDAATYPTHAVFFQAPLGYATISSYSGAIDLLNACGYYIAFSDNGSWIPPIPGLNQTSQKRYRLMELCQPAENLEVYTDTSSTALNWVSNAITKSEVRAIADNVIALIVQPKLSTQDQSVSKTILSTDYTYNSRVGSIQTTGSPSQPLQMHQMPPLINITLVAIDETSAKILANKYGSTPPPLVGSSLFKQVSNYDADMKTLTDNLVSLHINYHIFTSDVPIRSAKWSTQ